MELWECLTAACKAFSLVNAKEKDTDGLVIRSLDDYDWQMSEISARNLHKRFGEFKTINSPLRDIHEWILSHSLVPQYFVICGNLREKKYFSYCKEAIHTRHSFSLVRASHHHTSPSQANAHETTSGKIISWGHNFGSAWSQGGNSECWFLLEPPWYFCYFDYDCG